VGTEVGIEGKCARTGFHSDVPDKLQPDGFVLSTNFDELNMTSYARLDSVEIPDEFSCVAGCGLVKPWQRQDGGLIELTLAPTAFTSFPRGAADFLTSVY
jgi:hypothetical protein